MAVYRAAAIGASPRREEIWRLDVDGDCDEYVVTRANRSLFASSPITQAIPRKTGACDRLAMAISTGDA
jgi:hypothetical protein